MTDGDVETRVVIATAADGGARATLWAKTTAILVFGTPLHGLADRSEQKLQSVGQVTSTVKQSRNSHSSSATGDAPQHLRGTEPSAEPLQVVKARSDKAGPAVLRPICLRRR